MADSESVYFMKALRTDVGFLTRRADAEAAQQHKDRLRFANVANSHHSGWLGCRSCRCGPA